MTQYCHVCKSQTTSGPPVLTSAVGVACVASVSVGFGSKERPRNGVFGILPARKMGREPKKERCNSLLPNCTETLATQATVGDI